MEIALVEILLDGLKKVFEVLVLVTGFLPKFEPDKI